MPRCTRTADEVQVETDHYTAAVALSGYTSGIRAGSFRDKRTGACDLGFGLDIVDFLLEPDDGRSQDPAMPYHSGDLFHGRIAKRYVELPQICTQARRLPAEVFAGEDAVVVRQRFAWTQAAQGYRPGSVWEQVLVFQDSLPYVLASDCVTSANDCAQLILRIDLPGHLKHSSGDCFEAVYLSYHGRIPAAAFAADFPPDAQFLYRRNDQALPRYLIRAYQTRIAGRPGPWLAGIVLEPSEVCEAWCHQRGYVCFIQEIGGRAVRAGQRFGAAYAIGFFDDIADMERIADRHRGWRGLRVAEKNGTVWWEALDQL
jgi:hypothetical protein